MPKPKPHTPGPISQDWNTLKELDRKALADLWQQAFGRPIPPKLYKPMVVLLLAYRLQELRFGGLTPDTQRYLASLTPRPTEGRTRGTPTRRLKPGTRLVRSWQGRTYTVTVADKGFLYEGETHKSLSTLARKITGTAWSGPKFFGLKVAATAKAAQA
jgi:hypothetical protein